MNRNIRIAKQLVRLANGIVASENDGEQCPYSVGQSIRVTGRIEKKFLNGSVEVCDLSNLLVNIVVKMPFVSLGDARKELEKRFFEKYREQRPEATDGEIRMAYRGIPADRMRKHVSAQQSMMQAAACGGIQSDWKAMLEGSVGSEVSFGGTVSLVMEEDILIAKNRWTVFVDLT